MRECVISAIEREKIIAIIRGVAASDLIPTVEALYQGGIRLVEVTYDASGGVSDRETAKNIEMLVEHFDEKMIVGAGTVLTEWQVKLTNSVGGRFVISPDSYQAVIEQTRSLELVSIPGALTPTEIQEAYRWGADFVKLFPVKHLGVDYVKAIRAPLSHIRLLAVGGVSVENMSRFLQAGVCGFGIGSDIIDRAAIRQGNFARIKELARGYVGGIAK